MTAKFLQSVIYVLGQPIELHLSWHRCVYRPSSMNKTNKVIETGKQFILTVSECVELIATAKRGELLQFPLILYKDRHYLAYVHCTVLVPGDTIASTADSSGEDMDISQDEMSDEEMKEDDEGLAEVVGVDT